MWKGFEWIIKGINFEMLDLIMWKEDLEKGLGELIAFDNVQRNFQSVIYLVVICETYKTL